MSEYWIFKGSSGFADRSEWDIGSESEKRITPGDGYYDLIATFDNIEGGVHVIEHRYYELRRQEVALLKDRLEKAETKLKYYGHTIDYNKG